MKGRLGHAALALGLAQFIGCAQGYDSTLDEEPPPLAGGFAAGSTSAGRGGATSQAGSGSRAGGGAGTMMTMYMGEPCERGETEACECEGDQGQGTRSCRQDDLSPTDGSFGPCEACVPDEDPAGMGGGGNGQSGSGSAGRSGSGSGSAGSAGSSSSSAGRGGSSGSSGRTGGSSGSSGGSNDPAWCFFVPVPLPGVCD